MPHRPETPSQLRAQGLRVTPQRLVILDVLQHADHHMSADEIFEIVHQRFPSTDISTVYRTLETLTALGMVQKVTLGESHDHFEWADEPHHHVVCEQCGAVMHFDDELLDELRTLLQQRYGFNVARAHLEGFGTCAACAASG
jgi:Fe2+ or Zn2+ uptake regulation protein